MAGEISHEKFSENVQDCIKLFNESQECVTMRGEISLEAAQQMISWEEVSNLPEKYYC